MRQLEINVVIGAMLGFFAMAVTFAAFSIVNPGWLREAFAAPTASSPVATGDGTAAPPSGNSGAEQTQPAPAGDVAVPTVTPLPTVEGACGGPEQMTIALLGVDDRGQGYDGRARTDAIVLVNVRFAERSAAMLSIPRDLYVPLPHLEEFGIDQSRINTAYLYGELYDVPGGGPAQLKSTIELNFGIRVDRYVLINFAAFEAAVDALDGIDVDVPVAIYDPQFPADGDTGTIVFAVPAGLQHMDGRTALRYARTRHQDDDYHRVQRQQHVLFAIRDRLLRPAVVPQVPALIAAFQGSLRTDLSPGEIAALACVGPQIDRTQITALSIDGTMVLPWTTPSGGRVSIPNRAVIAPVVEEFLGR